MEQTSNIGSIETHFTNAIVNDIDGTLNVFVYNEETQKFIYNYDIVLENVNIQICSNGVLNLTGEEIRWDIFFCEPPLYESLDSNKYILNPRHIKQRKIFGIKYGKPIYNKTYIEFRERKPFHVTTSNYRITEV